MDKAAKKAISRRASLMAAGTVALAATYAFASLAIDRGSYWHYAFGLTTFLLAIKYFWLGIKKLKKHHE